LQKKARVAFSDQEGRNELLGGEDSHSSEDQVGFCMLTQPYNFLFQQLIWNTGNN